MPSRQLQDLRQNDGPTQQELSHLFLQDNTKRFPITPKPSLFLQRQMGFRSHNYSNYRFPSVAFPDPSIHHVSTVLPLGFLEHPVHRIFCKKVKENKAPFTILYTRRAQRTTRPSLSPYQRSYLSFTFYLSNSSNNVCTGTHIS